MLLELSGCADLGVEYAPPRQGEIMRNYSDLAHARAILGYEPQVPLDKGLEQTWRWFEKEHLG